MIHAIELFLDSYMADAYPISWFTPVMLACISFIHPRRPAQWATLFVVLAVTIGLCIATSALGLVKYGWIMFCGMLAIWYSAAPIYMIFDGSFNKEWLYIGKPSFVFWLSYSSTFFGGIAFVMATTLSFVDYGFLPTFVCLLILCYLLLTMVWLISIFGQVLSTKAACLLTGDLSLGYFLLEISRLPRK